MNTRNLLCVLFLGMAVSACTQFTPYRTQTLAASPAESQPKILECKLDSRQKGERVLCENGTTADTHAIQHRHYQANFQDDASEQLDYYLSVVEFDDQGWFADRTQMEALFALLGKLEKENNGHVLINVYAHGWKHNASPCDNNVVCFSRLLERTDAAEMLINAGGDPKGKRTVVGVYLGWRGLPVEAGALTNLSFWSRKEAAARVGHGGVFELLTRLNNYRDNRQSVAKPNQGVQTQLTITGHSFGGLVIYSALSHAMMERAAKTTVTGGKLGYEAAQSFGDFVMLINPAFEGSLYEPLFNIATHRCYDTNAQRPTGQRPVMMIVTSEADSATGIAFPAGRTFSTLLQHAASDGQSRSMRQTVGHDNRYQTHRLVSVGVAPPKEPVDERACGCPYLTATFDWDVDKLKEPFTALLRTAIAGKVGDGSYGKEVKLLPESIPQYASGYPYLVVTTDAEVIADHNAIYNDRFINFVQLFILNHITREKFERLPGDSDKACWRDAEVPGCVMGSPLPCARSCQMDDGSACAGIAN